MRVTRIHVPDRLAAGAAVALPEPAAVHLLRVLRLQAGDRCVLFNGDGCDYDATIATTGKRDVLLHVDAKRQLDNESPLRITLVQALARGEKMDLILQKATELGVHAVIPVSSERSEVRLDGERVDKRVAHWRGVIIAACEQSGRARVPHVAAPLALADALPNLDADARYLLDPQAGRSIAACPPSTQCALAIGPEGGWSPRDRIVLKNAGFEGLRLGPRVLRTETAGIAAIAALQARFGDLG